MSTENLSNHSDLPLADPSQHLSERVAVVPNLMQRGKDLIDRLINYKSELPPDEYAALIEEVSKAMTGR